MTLETKDKWIRLNFINRVITLSYSIINSIICTSIFLYNIIVAKPGSSFVNLAGLAFFLTCPILIFNPIFRFITNKHCFKKLVYESLDIVNTTNLPDKLPKVVYVYTTHNDFMPGRLLQSMNQTYKNIEYWISDGSSKEESRTAIDEFVKKNRNVKLYRLPRESKNKADNLNTFLKNSSVKFDYLMISDSDEIINKNFVNNSLRFFYSKKLPHLAYVSGMSNVYSEKYLFSYATRQRELLGNLRQLFYNFQTSDRADLFGNCAIISNKFLSELKYSFPDSNLEDEYTGAISIKNHWTGFLSPLDVSMQANDQTSNVFYKRLMRIADWRIRWWQSEKPFKNYNEKYSIWFFKKLMVIFQPFFIFFGTLLTSIFVYIVYNYHLELWNQKFFLISVIVSFCMIPLSFLTNFWISSKIKKRKWEWFLFPFFQFLVVLAFIPKLLYHWFNCFAKHKYSEFGGSPKRNFESNVSKSIYQSRFDFLWMLINAIIIISINLLFYFLNCYDTPWLIVLMFLTITCGIFFLSHLSNLVLNLLSCIPSNKNYDPLIFLYNDDPFLEFNDIKKKYYSDHKGQIAF